MITERTVRVVFVLIVSLFATVMLPACGGGGGGGDGGGVNPAYTGVTTQATITTGNARDIALGAYQGGAAGQALVVPLGAGAGPATVNNRLLTFAALSRDLAQAVRPAPAGSVTPQTTFSDSAPGSCGGAMNINMDVNDVNGSFSGSLGFSSYCDEGMVLNGSASFSGRVNTTTGALSSFALSFQGLTMVDSASGQSLTLAGSESLAISGDGLTMTQTLDMVLIDHASGRTCWVNNYRMSLSVDPGGAYADVSISGRFYDPDRGYVDVATEVPLHILTGASDASAGVLLFYGEGSTSARLTINGDGTYLIEADADGDGSYEWNILYTPPVV